MYSPIFYEKLKRTRSVLLQQIFNKFDNQQPPEKEKSTSFLEEFKSPRNERSKPISKKSGPNTLEKKLTAREIKANKRNSKNFTANPLFDTNSEDTFNVGDYN